MTDINYDALIRADPAYQASVADIIRRRLAAAIQYGDASGVPGVDANTAAVAAANPYSTVADLLRQHLTQNSTLGNTANAHGALFSGGYAQSISNEAQRHAQAASAAATNLQNYLSGLTSEENQAYTGSYRALAANPPGLAAPPTLDTPSPSVPAAPPPGVSTTANGQRVVNFAPQLPDLLKPAAYRRPRAAYPPVRTSGPRSGV